MGKSKDVKTSSGKKAKAAPVVEKVAVKVEKVVAKPSKDASKKAVNGKKSKKVESSSESSSEEDSDDSASESGSDSDSDEEMTDAKPITNGKAKAAAAETSDSDSDDSSESEDEKPAAKTAKVVANGKKVDTNSDSDSDSDDSVRNPSHVNVPAKANTYLQSEDDDEASSDSDDSESEEATTSEEEIKKSEVSSKKRKADDEETDATSKKTKTEEDGEEKPKTLWVGNLGWDVTDDVLMEEFKAAGDVVSARVVYDQEQQRSRGFGYVDFSNAEECEKAFNAKSGAELMGRELRLDFASKAPPKRDNNARANDRAQRHGDTVSPESDTLFVGNLAFNCGEETVSGFFNEIAKVTSLRLPTDM